MVTLNQTQVMFSNRPVESQIDRMLDDVVQSQHGWSSTWEPRCNVYEDENGFGVQIALPGIKVCEIDVRVEDSILLVAGQRKGQAWERKTWYTRDFQEGHFACSF